MKDSITARYATPSVVLRKAHERIQQGWTQGTYHDYENGSVCAIGVVQYDQAALGDRLWNEPLLERLLKVIKEQYPDRFDRIMKYYREHCTDAPSVGWQVISFNDDDETTQDDVLAVFEKAAIAAEEAGE